MTKAAARIFLVTSFQGGIGKTFFSMELAKKMRVKSGRPVVLIEFNMLRPSYLVSYIGEAINKKFSFLDFYKSNWAISNVDSFKRLFYCENGIYYLPFCGNKGLTETLKPGFQLNEHDFAEVFNHLVKLADELKGSIIVDLHFQMSAFPIFMFSRSDVILYVYSEKLASSSFAEHFKFESKKFHNTLEKIIWCRNFADLGSKTIFKNLLPEYSFPIRDNENTTKFFDNSMEKLVNELLKRTIMGSSAIYGMQDHDTETKELIEYRRKKQLEVISTLDNRFGLSDAQLREIVEEKIDILLEKDPPKNSGINVPLSDIKKFLMDEILGLGPLEDFMHDDDVDEIMVNGPDKVFIEKHGKIKLTVRQFSDDQHVKTVIERILRPIGKTVNEKTPYVDARLSDGSRVHAIIPPLSLTGPMITIRKFSRIPYTMDDLVYKFKSASEEAAEFLKLCVHMKRNIIVSGGASSGKTTLLNVLSNFIYPTERIITIEDSAELRLNRLNLGRLETRQQGIESRNQVTIRDLVRNALRMRPDRIIIGECRGGEAIDMLQAMNTGHDGSLTTLHANTSRDALSRLETMVLMGGLDLPLRAIREQIASSVNIIIQKGRLSDGKRVILEIVEIVGIKDNVIQTQTIFKFEKKWIGEDGSIVGELKPTGVIPNFIKDMSPEIFEKYKYLFTKKDETEAKTP